MPEKTEKSPERVEAENHLARTCREIETMEKELLGLREKLRIAEQKEIDARSAAGKDPAPFAPTPEMEAVLKAISKTEGALGLHRLRETELKERIAKLESEALESELIEVSKSTVELKRREQELSEELDRVRKKLASAEARSAELAERIAAQSKE